MIRGVVAGEPVVGAVVPAVPPVVEVELGALVLQRVHAGIDVDQKLKERIILNRKEGNLFFKIAVHNDNAIMSGHTQSLKKDCTKSRREF